MPRKMLLSFLQLFLAGFLSAQSGAGLMPNTFEHNIEVFDANGATFVNKGLDIAGSPFYLDEWKYGRILLNSGKGFAHIQFRLNLQSQEVHYLTPGHVEMFIPAGTVKIIQLLTDSSANSSLLAEFQSGFPGIDGQNQNSFYQVLSRGKILLLRYDQRNIKEQKDEFSGEVKKQYASFTSYYLFSQGTMQKVKKDKSFLLPFMEDKKDKVATYIEENKLKIKSFDDLKTIIDYYNSLP